MNINSRTGSHIEQVEGPESLQLGSSASVEPWKRDYLDFLHVNVLYCGGIHIYIYI